jgi:hypothetical protein
LHRPSPVDRPAPLPPHDTRAERVLLSGCLKEPDCVAEAWRAGVRPADFHWHHHATAFAGLVALYDLADGGHEPGPYSLWLWVERFAAPGDFGSIGGYTRWVGGLWDADPTGAHVWHGRF